MLEQFHFIHPAWLLALAPLALLAWFAFRPGAGGNPWRRVVDARLLPLMMSDSGSAANRSAPWLLAAGWLVAVVALADPTCERRPQPVFQTGAARVVVLDLADSMNDADLAPSRLARARYKVEDVLAQGAEGRTGLVAYAGDAFVVAPLTRDANTIRSLLKVLEPDLMPVQGSRADLGLRKAGELLRQAGAASGQILLIADGVEAGKTADALREAARLRGQGYRVSVLGVGTPAGAPLTDAQGRLDRGSGGDVQVPRLDASTLQSLAQAGGGQYRSITDGGTALQALLDAGTGPAVRGAAQAGAPATAWKELGPAIVVLLLPLAALAFRRDSLVSAALLAALVAPSQGAMAATWPDLWQRPDQQAAKALAAGDYAAAAKTAPDAGRRGSAQYELGDYPLALASFSRDRGTDADYNRGNALARLGRYPDAVAAYDKAIAESPSNDDAKANKAAVEALMKQDKSSPQKQQQQQQQQQGQQQQAGSKGSSTSASPAAAKAGGGGQGQPRDAGAKSGQGGASTGASGQGGDAPASKAPPSAQGSTASSGADANAASRPAPRRGGQASPDGAQGRSAPANAFAQALQKLAHWAGGNDRDDASDAAGSAAASPTSAARRQAAAASQPGGTAQPLDSEEKLAAQQWLGRIPDDPGGLLRRKFLYQYRQRAQQPDAGDD